MIFPCRTIGMLSDREPKERTAGCLARHQIGHLGVQTLRIRKGELDPVWVDSARRPDLTPKELVKLHHAKWLSWVGSVQKSSTFHAFI